MTLLSHASALVADFSVSAEDEPMFDPNSVTPGVIGFLATFVVIVIVVLLATDMVRRVRRTQYRAEVNERLDAEAAALIEQERGAEDGNDNGSKGDLPER